MASRKKKFLYVILSNHYFKVGDQFKQRLGYGVTNDPVGRARKYSNTSGGEQEFCMLYYSPNYEVEEVEKILKRKLSDDCHQIHGEDVEWISPHSDIDTASLISMIDQIIGDLRINVRKLKPDYLPFSPAWHSNVSLDAIETNLDTFLEIKA